MIKNEIIHSELKAKGKPSWLPLITHLEQVAKSALMVVEHLEDEFERSVVFWGCILHDVGKASPIFQERLIKPYDVSWIPYRHEIGSLFFISLFPDNMQERLIEMVIAHHKPIRNDYGKRGVLDLVEEWGEEIRDFHLTDWEEWSPKVLNILEYYGIKKRELSREEAIKNFERVVEYCEHNAMGISSRKGFSKLRGLINIADYYASAFEYEVERVLSMVFKKPDLSFFNRRNRLYPLSYEKSECEKKHTIVVAPTGAGKTDYLFRRTKKRIFYTLPFQASINAMYSRIKKDLKDTNPDLDIRVLHSASKQLSNLSNQDKTLQKLSGSSIKILTPHQICSIIFGLKGYESVLLDLSGNDIVLDEIHTYSGNVKSMILELIKVLKSINCRIHIGTATMPTSLYNNILEILNPDETLEIKLKSKQLQKFNRHIIHKINDFECSFDVINSAVKNNEKVLLVANQVKISQDWYKILKDKYPNTPIMLLHSRFKRKHRNEKEHRLIGLNNDNTSSNMFNTSDKACIVVSTQVVEVSVDISFDIMITQSAPIDSMIQRFGRINRKRNKSTIGKYKPIYIIKPSQNRSELLPYEPDTLYRSFNILPNNSLLDENKLQKMIDDVFPYVPITDIKTYLSDKDNCVPMTHNEKSGFLELLNIENVSVILESDVDKYKNGYMSEQNELEISIRYKRTLENFPRLHECGSEPFIIPDSMYSEEFGLIL